MDQYFIELMVEQVRKGNRFEDHLFSKRAWKFMSSFFTARFKFPYGKDVLKNRHKTLRNLFKSVQNLLKEDGFSWDETRQMVNADNYVWDESLKVWFAFCFPCETLCLVFAFDFLKVHPDSRSFRIKSVPYYKDLCSVYKDGMSEQKGTFLLILDACGMLEDELENFFGSKCKTTQEVSC